MAKDTLGIMIKLADSAMDSLSKVESFHHDRLPGNLYVVDVSLIPESLGNPPILTIVALVKRISKLIACNST